jgi:DNA-binding CsgD family transcriptional regulator/5-methylcytosine-specific restriction endonuclease McrA
MGGVAFRPTQLGTFVRMPGTRKAVAELHSSGVPVPEIARRLRLAPTTVSYHVERILRREDVEQPAEPPESVVTTSKTREAVAGLLADGLTHVEIARRLGVSKPTVTYHAGRLGSPIDHRCGGRFDWTVIQRYYDEGHSVRDCIKAFGFSSASWSAAVKRGAIVARPSATPMSELLVAGTYRGRNNLKLRLVKEGLKENRCERCGLDQWYRQPLSIALHHINGDRLDNRLENLALLCPNCHSQTDTYSGRNGHRRRRNLRAVT